jgi:hypothetical protein
MVRSPAWSAGPVTIRAAVLARAQLAEYVDQLTVDLLKDARVL